MKKKRTVMKKKIFVLLTGVLIFRFLVFYLLKTDPVFWLSPRNFNGRGLLTVPVLWDFLLPLAVVLSLRPRRMIYRMEWKDFPKVGTAVFVILIAPVLTALLLFRYIESREIIYQINGDILLRYFLVPLSFYAGNLFIDRLTLQRRWLRRAVILLFLIPLVLLQDVFPGGDAMYIVLGLLTSVGTTTFLLILGLRKWYGEAPVTTLMVVALGSVFFTFFAYNGVSSSVFTLLLPSMSMIMATWTVRLSGVRRVVPLGLPLLGAAFLGLYLPGRLTEPQAEAFLLKKGDISYGKEKTGSVTVQYADTSLREFSLMLGRVLDAANHVSREEFGISPEVNELVIIGYGPGGFHGEYPARIVGRVIGKEYLRRCRDHIFLNDSALSPAFPDPVNAILHEYSHLYGSVPYFRWMPGAEEEGWATFSATVLSRLLHERYGDSLWSPAYNYARQAEKITRRNLRGKAVVWSHPNEYGGFRLWYHLGENMGVVDLYRKRWNTTCRDRNVAMMLFSDPRKALNTAKTFGLSLFREYGKGEPVPFGHLYSREEYLTLARLTGMDTTRILNMYRMAEKKMIDPRIPLPEDASE